MKIKTFYKGTKSEVVYQENYITFFKSRGKNEDKGI